MKSFITPEEFFAAHNGTEVERIVKRACDIHASVNQMYGDDDSLPYSYHIVNVVDALFSVYHMGIPPALSLVFAAAFHDTIEDARMTYNDVMKVAKELLLDKTKAFQATEIVYALTNEKGRTRLERANDKYYEGIRSTHGASLIKMCDRYANMLYSMTVAKKYSMGRKYTNELPDFIAHVYNERDAFIAEFNEIKSELYSLANTSLLNNTYEPEDFVKLHDGRFMKIKSIVGDTVEGYGFEEKYKLSELTPIKLEPSDLMVNGFSMHSNVHGQAVMSLGNYDDKRTIHLVYDKGMCNNPCWFSCGEVFNIKYVHEVQHILRGFGYDAGTNFNIL